MSENYSNEFFDVLEAGSLRSARIMLARLATFYQPRSVVDIGCGRGAWLKAALELGAEEVLGLDGDYVDPTKLLVQSEAFRAADLSQPIDLVRRFDLATCLEVAEHLPPERAESLIADITRLSDVVLFSAAVPHQGGTNHINEQWPEYWAILFSNLGFEGYDLFRDEVWNNPDVEFWYAQNTFLYVRSGVMRDALPTEAMTRARPLARLHPTCFLLKSAGYGPNNLVLPQAMMTNWWQVAQAHIAGAVEIPPLLPEPQQDAATDADLTILVEELRAEIVELREQLKQSSGSSSDPNQTNEESQG